jgi:hypothetical protein
MLVLVLAHLAVPNSAFDVYEAAKYAAEGGKPAKGGKVSFN